MTLHNRYREPYIVGVVKSRVLPWTWQVAWIWETNIYRNYWYGKCFEDYDAEDNIKINLIKTVCEHGRWRKVTQDHVQCFRELI